jgi:hypothetical protein
MTIGDGHQLVDIHLVVQMGIDSKKVGTLLGCIDGVLWLLENLATLFLFVGFIYPQISISIPVFLL